MLHWFSGYHLCEAVSTEVVYNVVGETVWSLEFLVLRGQRKQLDDLHLIGILGYLEVETSW